MASGEIPSKRLRKIFKEGDAEGTDRVGYDCCGDRYACDATVACKCGCEQSYCDTHFAEHERFLMVKELLQYRRGAERNGER